MKDVIEKEWRDQCEKEPLQFSSAIQSYGALLFIQRETFVITHVSENIHLFFSATEHLQCGNIFTELGDISRTLLSTLADQNRHQSIVNNHETQRPLALTAVATSDGWIIECELDNQTYALLPSQVSEMHLAMRESYDEATLNEVLVKSMQTITGFDRVMIYKFDEEWNGEVITESVKATFGSYLNLHFPASDIPAIARNLYEKNPWRYIADANQPAALIKGLDNSEPLDLTLSELRSVSPMHIQYLQNMSVRSSFSIAIRLFNKLWGLIVCHHPTATHLPRSVRSHCFDFSVKYRLLLSEKITRSTMSKLDNMQRIIRVFYETLSINADDYEFTQRLFEYFCPHLQLSGVAVVNDQRILLAGVPIPDHTIQALDEFFCIQQCGLWQTNRSTEQFSDDALIGVGAAGIVAIRVKLKGILYRIYFLRSEKPYNIRWAGNPNKPQERVREGHLPISPRRSFETWVEEKRGKSIPWSKSDIAMISHLQITLLRN